MGTWGLKPKDQIKGVKGCFFVVVFFLNLLVFAEKTLITVETGEKRHYEENVSHISFFLFISQFLDEYFPGIQ